MDHAQGQDVFGEYAANLIRIKAKQLCRRRDFRGVDPADVQQDLWVSVARAADQFNPAKSSTVTFLHYVVRSGVAQLVRARHRQKRCNGVPTVSLHDLVNLQVPTSEPLAASVSAVDLARRTGSDSADEQQRRDDSDALSRALDEMPQVLRDVCRRIMGGTVTSVARDLGVSRRQVRKARTEARPYLERVGFNS
jgi:RNA polymerase sigma factor (sigma-70 family)